MTADVVIKDVTVIDGTGTGPAGGMDVVIRDGAFESIHRAAGAEGRTVLDGQGKFLIPGLWESHTHLRPVLKDDEEASQAMGGFGMVCGQRDVIEETEAHAHSRRGMMTGRTNEA